MTATIMGITANRCNHQLLLASGVLLGDSLPGEPAFLLVLEEDIAEKLSRSLTRPKYSY